MKVEFIKYGKPLTRENVQELGKYGNRFIVKTVEKRTRPGKNLWDDDEVYYETTIQVLTLHENITMFGGDFLFSYDKDITIDGYCPLEFDEVENESLTIMV